MDLKDATFQDQVHEHKHYGSSHPSFTYRIGPIGESSKTACMGGTHASGKHSHNEIITSTLDVDFSKMKATYQSMNQINQNKIL